MTRKTTLNLNEDLLAQAQAILGTRGIKDTIDRALQEVLVADARRKMIEYLTGLDADPEELRRQAWGECAIRRRCHSRVAHRLRAAFPSGVAAAASLPDRLWL